MCVCVRDCLAGQDGGDGNDDEEEDAKEEKEACDKAEAEDISTLAPRATHLQQHDVLMVFVCTPTVLPTVLLLYSSFVHLKDHVSELSTHGGKPYFLHEDGCNGYECFATGYLGRIDPWWKPGTMNRFTSQPSWKVICDVHRGCFKLVGQKSRLPPDMLHLLGDWQIGRAHV